MAKLKKEVLKKKNKINKESAPDLLEALQDLIEHIEIYAHHNYDLKKAKAAIRKAKN